MSVVEMTATQADTAEKVVRRVLSNKNIQFVTANKISVSFLIEYFSVEHAKEIQAGLKRHLPKFRFSGPTLDRKTGLMRIKVINTAKEKPIPF